MSDASQASRTGPPPSTRRILALLALPTLLLTVLTFVAVFGITATAGRQAVESRLWGWIPWILALNHSIVFAALVWQLRREGSSGLESIGWTRLPASRFIVEVALGLVLAGATFLLDDVAFDALEDVFESMLGRESGGAGLGESLRSVPWGWLVVGTVLPWVEESLFRGWAISRLHRRWPLALAIAVPTLMFGPLHWGQGLWAILNATLIGLVFALVYVWRRNLWAAAVAHSGFNAIVILEFLWR